MDCADKKCKKRIWTTLAGKWLIQLAYAPMFWQCVKVQLIHITIAELLVMIN